MGMSRLLPARPPAGTFSWAGALGPVALPAEVVEQVQWTAQTLAREWELQGMVGMDFLLDGAAQICVVDVNPRLVASAPLYSGRFARGYVHAHMEACAGHGLPDPQPPQDGMVRGLQVIYAPTRLRMMPGMQWPEGVSDLPQVGKPSRQGTRCARSRHEGCGKRKSAPVSITFTGRSCLLWNRMNKRREHD